MNHGIYAYVDMIYVYNLIEGFIKDQNVNDTGAFKCVQLVTTFVSFKGN